MQTVNEIKLPGIQENGSRAFKPVVRFVLFPTDIICVFSAAWPKQMLLKTIPNHRLSHRLDSYSPVREDGTTQRFISKR